MFSPADDKKDYRDQQADQNAGRNRNKQLEITAVYYDVSRQFAWKWKLVGELQEDTCNNHHYPCND